MGAAYNFGIKAYATAARLVSHRNAKAARMLEGQQQTFAKLRAEIVPGEKYLWVHAASLGEFEQGRPFIEMVRREIPQMKILLTFFSPSGYEVRKNYSGADIVCYLPFDTPANAAEFVAIVKPAAAFFVKYEFWRNYLSELYRAGIPTYLISSIFRRRQPFFKWWGVTFRRMLRCYTNIFVQDRESLRLLEGIGVRNALVSGDTRFDRVTDIMRTAHDIPGLDDFADGAPMVMVAGSSWPADESVFIPWLAEHKEVKCILAPHEFDDERIENLRSRLGRGTVLMSEVSANPSIAAGARHIIIDCFGLLSSIYRYGDVAYVGGGFGAGIHNINEPAVYGIPVVFGPNNKRFKEAVDMIECGGALEIRDRQSFALVMDALLDKRDREKRGKCAGDYIRSHLGATQHVFDTVEQTLRKAVEQ